MHAERVLPDELLQFEASAIGFHRFVAPVPVVGAKRSQSTVLTGFLLADLLDEGM